jgi:AraC family L-rhamnose operon transcriptional activator RhaR/AraC family L-rhamnose operon regulatory protein RhaS
MTEKKLRHQDYFADRNLPVDIHEEYSQRTIALHRHDFSELVVISGGEGLHYTEDSEYLVIAGDCFLIPPDLAHGYKTKQGLQLTNILFHPRLLEYPRFTGGNDIMPGFYALFSFEPEYRKQHNFAGRLRLSPAQLLETAALIREIKEEKKQKEEGYVFMAMALLMRIIGYLSRCYVTNKSPETRPLLRLGTTFSYIEQNFSRDISLRELAELAHMSESSLNRAFKKTCGLAPIEYLIDVRIRESCGLLLHSEMPVGEIAHKVGFIDSNYFSRQFRKIMQVSPRNYRRGG